MPNNFFSRIITRFSLLMFFSVLLTACGGGDGKTPTGSTPAGSTPASAVPVTTTGASASTLAIATSQTSLKSDNSNSATITVTAIDANNVLVPNVTVNFASNGGVLSVPSAITNASGSVTVTVSSGAVNQTNRTITITASASGAPSVAIPIQITGSSVSLTSASTVLVSGTTPTTTTLTVKASNAGGVGVYNMPVTLTVTGTGNVTLTPSSGVTDVNGQLTITVTGMNSGIATVTATALGATKTQNFTVSASGSEFRITAPVTNPAALTKNTGSLIFSIQPGASSITHIRLSSTIGTWTSCPGTGINTSVCVVPVATPTATLNSTLAGIASVQADGCSNAACATVVVSDTKQVVITSAIAAAINLQANVNVIQPSSGSTSNTATITATVRDATNQPVGNSAVLFTLVNTTGGGETIAPAVVLSSDGIASTDPIGQAKTTFTSGSLPTIASGDIVRGMVVGSGNGFCLNTESGSNNGGTAICADTMMNIGGTAGSIVIGQSDKITSVPGDTTSTTYQLPMNLLVADSNGNPVKGAVVSLGAWPVYFSTGVYAIPVGGATSCVVDLWATFRNEDLNANLILNPGEDLTAAYQTALFTASTPYSAGPPEVQATYSALANLTRTYWNPTYANGPTPSRGTYIADGILTPGNSAGGNLPATVTTDTNGLATFYLTYLKEHAIWITTRITAKTTVQGTESTTSLTFTLPVAIPDLSIKSGQYCTLPNSPYNQP